MNVRAIVDRIEEDLAVLEIERKGEIIWPVKLLPNGIKPGNILEITISLNPQAEAKQREKIKKLQERLKES